MNDSTPDRIVIVGAGYTGLAAAFDLAKAGKSVTVVEKDATIGGLAGAFEISPGYWVEKFYHHWFTSDTAILDFIKELGLEDKLEFRGTNTGLYFANSIFRLASPLDLLRFHPLPLIDRIRTGLMALIARRIENWGKLENESSEDWIRRVGGEKGYQVIWKPLLKGKFGPEASNVSAVWFWNKLKLRGSSRNAKGREELVYFDGGFEEVTKGMLSKLKSLGVEVKTSTPVSRVVIENGKVTGVEAGGSFIPAKTVLATTPLPLFLDLVPELPANYKEKYSKVRFLGNVCLVLRLRKSLSSTYWLNVADPNFPYVGIIEHTNFEPPEKYGGERIAYLSKYLPTSDPMFRMSDEELYAFSIPHIQRMFPSFEPNEWVIGYKVWRAEYSQPVITKRYSELIPSNETPIGGLWLSTMSQVYPEDRGTNYAIRHGRNVAKMILEKKA